MSVLISAVSQLHLRSARVEEMEQQKADLSARTEEVEQEKKNLLRPSALGFEMPCSSVLLSN